MRSVLLWWSGGKDAAWSLHRLLDDAEHRVVALVSTLDPRSGRVPYQGATRALLESQALAAGLPLWPVELDFPCSDVDYEDAFAQVARRAREEGIESMAFGDLHLADLRSYRERLVATAGLSALFPLWGEPTGPLARTMIEEGLQATVTCVDPTRIPRKHLGDAFDAAFLAALPAGVDACGEGGEFHTVVSGGPMLHHPIALRHRDVRARGRFLELGVDLESSAEALEIDGELDLHPFPPKQVKALVSDYLDECRSRGILEIRLVHGKGIGALRETVHALLRQRDDVESFGLAGDTAGGWGATRVRLKVRPAGRP